MEIRVWNDKNYMKNFENFTGEEIEKENLPRKTPLMIANPPYKRFMTLWVVKFLRISRLKSNTFLTHMIFLFPIVTG